MDATCATISSTHTRNIRSKNNAKCVQQALQLYLDAETIHNLHMDLMRTQRTASEAKRKAITALRLLCIYPRSFAPLMYIALFMYQMYSNSITPICA